MVSTSLIQGTIEIKLLNGNITPAMLLKSQIAHYSSMKNHPRLECRILARQTLFNLQKSVL